MQAPTMYSTFPTTEQVNEWKQLYEEYFKNEHLINHLYNADHQERLVKEKKYFDFVPNTKFVNNDRSLDNTDHQILNDDIIDDDTTIIFRRLVNVIDPEQTFENFYSSLARGQGWIQPMQIQKALASTLKPYLRARDSSYNLKITVHTPRFESVEFDFRAKHFCEYAIYRTLVQSNLLIHFLFNKTIEFEINRIRDELLDR